MTNISYKDIIEAVQSLESKIDGKFNEMKNCYVSQDQFTPVRNIVYGMVGFILLAVLGSIVSFVIVKYTPVTAQNMSNQIAPIVKDIGDTIAKF